MAWWQWLLGILMFFVALGVLVGIHELGHLSMAKLFHVYCFNYSIGFGPKIISSKRTDKHETIWTLRAIPLGGFVSMYGEGAELDEGLYIPPSRSLEGVARHKRAIIVSAGVILNTVLGFFLMMFSNMGTQTKFTFVNPGNEYESCIILSSHNNSSVKTNDALKGVQDPVSGEFILDSSDYKPTGSDEALAFTFTNSLSYTNKDPVLTDSIVFYKKISLNDAIEKGVTNFSNDSKFGFIAGQNRADILAPLIYNNKTTEQKKNTNYSSLYNEVKGWNKQKQVDTYKVELTNAFKNRKLDFGIDTSKAYNVDKNATHFTVKYYTYECTNYEKKIYNKNAIEHTVTRTRWN